MLAFAERSQHAALCRGMAEKEEAAPSCLMCCLLGVGPLFIFILHSFRRDRKLSDVVQVHLDLSCALSLGWADGTIDDDLLHKGEDHIVRYFCAVAIFASKGKVLVGLCGGGLHFVQPSLIIYELGFECSFFLFVLCRQPVKAFLRDMPQSIVLVQLLQQVFQTGDVLFLLTDLLRQLLPVIRLVSSLSAAIEKQLCT